MLPAIEYPLSTVVSLTCTATILFSNEEPQRHNENTKHSAFASSWFKQMLNVPIVQGSDTTVMPRRTKADKQKI